MQTRGSLRDCSVALVSRGDFCRVAIHGELEASGSAEEALPRKLKAGVGKFVVAFPGNSKVGVCEVGEFRAGYIRFVEHVLERFDHFLDVCVAMGNAVARVRQWTDGEVRQFFIFQVAVLVVDWIAVIVFRETLIADAVYDAFAFFVVGTEIDG